MSLFILFPLSGKGSSINVREIVNIDEICSLLLNRCICHKVLLQLQLQSSKIQLEVTVEQLWNKLHVLWERLEVPEAKQEKFMEGKEGFRSSVIEAVSIDSVLCTPFEEEGLYCFAPVCLSVSLSVCRIQPCLIDN